MPRIAEECAKGQTLLESVYIILNDFGLIILTTNNPELGEVFSFIELFSIRVSKSDGGSVLVISMPVFSSKDFTHCMEIGINVGKVTVNTAGRD